MLTSALVVAGYTAAATTGSATTAPFAEPSAPSVASPAGGTLRVTVAMILVLGAVLGAAWVMRRMRNMSGSSAGSLEVLAQVSLGTRERAVLIRVGEQQLLLGVGPGNVRTLHVLTVPMSAQLPDAASDPQRPTFKSMLMRSLGK